MLEFLIFIIALLINLTIHEASHAIVAFKLGDPTAKNAGRVSLNPVRHLDLIGSLVFLITQQIGWGKPVPVNPANFRNPVKDNALTALAGPLSSFLLAFSMVFPWKYGVNVFPEIVLLLIQYVFHISVFLGVFNLLPIPPLDGSKILGFFVPRKYYLSFDNFLEQGQKYFIVIILIDVFILGNVFGFSILAFVLSFLAKNIEMLMFLGA
ncbi:MAG: site-2 protease family protein [Candidatus Gracilibacteria bacterium]|jgi:Zn-dependent protease|nr:site-2 protease family protein [Candidatus Gracilibacteria bacterium]